jgi:hypothetical protein
MKQPRSSPYVYITWLKKLLVGDCSCEWATWFKAHYIGFKKVTRDFDLATWKMQHVALLSRVRAELEAQGKLVHIEGQNHFKLTGNSGTMLVGQPDLIATSDGEGLICDVKTGQPSTSDVAQVLIYMWAVPHAIKHYKGIRFEGQVVYKDHQVSIPSSAIDENFKLMLFELIKKVASNTPARRVPSRSECGYCEITKEDCEDRFDPDLPDDEPLEVQDF